MLLSLKILLLLISYLSFLFALTLRMPWGGLSASGSVPGLRALIVNCGRFSFPVSWIVEERGGGDHGEVPSASMALNKPQGSEVAGLVSNVRAQLGFASVEGL